MKKTISVLLTVLMCINIFAGCASNDSGSNKKHKRDKDEEIEEVETTKDTEEREPKKTEPTVIESEDIIPSASESSEVSEPTETSPEETISDVSEISYKVTNNNQYFVEVNDRVYFRVYGDAAFVNPTVFGNFQYGPTGNLSSIYYYDKTTGEVVYAFDDWGFGNIVFYNGVFYMNGYEKAPNGDISEIVYAVDMDGNSVDSFPNVYGSIVGNNDACHQFYVSYNDYDYETGEQTNQLLTFADDGSLVAVYDCPTAFRYIDCSPDFIILTVSEVNDYDDYVIALYSLSTPDVINGYTVTKLGTFDTEPMQSVTIEQYWYSDLEEVEYISVGYYEGTGHFLTQTEFYSIIPWEENSLEFKIKMVDEERNKYFNVIDGEIVVTDVRPDTFFLNTYDSEMDKDLMYVNPVTGESEVYYSNYISSSDYYGERYFDFYSENVNGIGFFMKSKVIFDDSASIGWRDGFRLITMEYLLINESGELVPLINIDHSSVDLY